MGTTADKLNKILESKADIKSAISSKGVSVDDNLSTYGDKIRSIQGGGDGLLENWLNNNGYAGLQDGILDAFNYCQSVNDDPATTWSSYISGDASKYSHFLLLKPTYPVAITSSYSYRQACLYIGGNLTVEPGLVSISDWFRNNLNLLELHVPEFSDVINAANAFQLNVSLLDLSVSLPSCTIFTGGCYSNIKMESADVVLSATSPVSFNSAFNRCDKLKTVTFNNGGTLHLANSVGQDWFRSCTELVTIDAILDVSLVPGYLAVFDDCPALQNVKVYGMSFGGLSFGLCPNISVESIMYMFDNAATVTDTQHIYLGSTNLAKLTAEQKAVATNKGWTLQ